PAHARVVGAVLPGAAGRGDAGEDRDDLPRAGAEQLLDVLQPQARPSRAARLLTSPPSSSLPTIFREQVSFDMRMPKISAVIGSGSMGPGIAALLARYGSQVRLNDISEEALARAEQVCAGATKALDQLDVPVTPGGSVSCE